MLANIKIILLSFLIQFPLVFYSYGQNKDLNIRMVVDEFCLCQQKAKGSEEQNTCMKILETLKPITSISKEDSIYIIAAFKGDCGRRGKKHNRCTFLQESDLIDYHLKKTEESADQVEWAGEEVSDQKIVSLSDHREEFKNEHDAELMIKSYKQILGNELDLVFEKKDDNLSMDIGVYSLEWVMNLTAFQILIRYKKLSAVVIITMKQNDKEAVMKLLDKVILRIKDPCH